jgi:hypothetical protein
MPQNSARSNNFMQQDDRGPTQDYDMRRIMDS